jgi:hypothetical protein
MLDLPQLGQLIAERHTTDLFRLETLPAYRAASDEEDYQRYLAGEDAPNAAAKQPWLDRLRTDTAAGRRWRRVHVLQPPLSDYLRYECEWGYAYNSAHGEDVRILELNDTTMRAVTAVGDFFVIDGHHVICSTYDSAGTFIGADLVAPGTADPVPYLALAEVIWVTATPFPSWWRAHPEYHRNPHAA